MSCSCSSKDDGDSATVSTTLQLFLTLWPHQHAPEEIIDAINHDNSGRSISSLVSKEEAEPKDDSSAGSSAGPFLIEALRLFEDWEPQSAWNNTPNLAAAVLAFEAFKLGCEGFQLTVEEHSGGDVVESDDFVPNYTILLELVEIGEIEPLSIAMVQFALWYLVGFQKSQFLKRATVVSEPPEKKVPARYSRTLSIAEFMAGTPYENIKSNGDFCIFVSHRWQTPQHPDPDNSQADVIKEMGLKVQLFLDILTTPSLSNKIVSEYNQDSSLPELSDSGRTALAWLLVREEMNFAIQFFIRQQRQVRLWYDFLSVPQGKDTLSRNIRAKCLPEIASLCRDMIFVGLVSDDYFARGWCAFEMIQHKSSAVLVGTKLFTNEHEGETPSGGSLVGYLSQLYTEFRCRSIHGRFCSLLENQQPECTTTELLRDLGISCTNGSDLCFVADTLFDQIKNNCAHTLVTFVHPFLNATGQLLEESLVPPILSAKRQRTTRQTLRPKNVPPVLVKYCFQWRTQLRSLFKDEEPEALAAKVKLKWRYPDNCIDHLLETRLDLCTIPNFEDRENQARVLLETFRQALSGLPIQTEWEECSAHLDATDLDSLQSILDFPGHFVLIEFSST